MFTIEWLSTFLQLLVLIPSAISCYLPAKNRMRFSMSKTVLLCCAAILPFAFAAASTAVAFGININIVVMPAIVGFFFLYRLTVRLDTARSLAIYIGVCAVQTFPSHFANIFEMYAGNDGEYLTVYASLVLLMSSWALAAAFIYPARQLFSKTLDELEQSRIWFMTVPISLMFCIFNMIALPFSYNLILVSRLKFLYPALEVFALVLLIMIYVLFYRASVIILEHDRLEKRLLLTEMQAQQFRELREYMRRTALLRHDFRQSVRLLAGLAEKEDIQSIRAYLSEYEQRFSESAAVNYCANASLNALFAYYHGIAKTEGIKTDWRIELPDPLTVSELDMAALFGNLMENAISACSVLPREQRYFGLTAEIRHENSLYVVSTNSFDGKVRKSADGYRSTKHSGRGTGLISVAAVAEKYGGTLRAYNSETEFFVDIVIKI